MTILEAILLGAVQGVTEFLPVSSSGHLVLAQKIFGIKEASLVFDTMLHVGTLGAVIAALRKDVLRLLRRPFQPLTAYLALATLPVVIAAFALGDSIESLFQSADMLGWAFLVTAAALFASERLAVCRTFRRKPDRLPCARAGAVRGEKDMTWVDAFVIGFAQALAILPAVSRSGMTLSAGLARKFERPFAARFAFLLAIPAIGGAFLLQLKEAAEGGISGMQAEILNAPVLAGTLTAALVGFASVTLMLSIVRKRGLYGFAFYTALLGLLIIIDQNLTRLVF